MRRGAFAIAVMLLACLPVKGFAEVKSVNRIELRNWAVCLAKSDKRTARKIVNGEPHALYEAIKGGFFSVKTCTNSKSRTVPGLTFLGPMSEYLLKMDFKGAGPFAWDENVEELKREVDARLADGPVSFLSSDSIRSSRSYLGLCLLKRNPDGASRLLASEITSEVERQIVEAMVGDINACVLPDQAIDITFDDLRSSIAIVRYQLLRRVVKDKDNA